MELGHRVIPRLEAAPHVLKVTLAVLLPAPRHSLAERPILCLIVSVALQFQLVALPKVKPSGPKNYKTQKSDLKIKHGLALLD